MPSVGGDFLPVCQVKEYEKHLNLLDKVLSRQMNVVTITSNPLKFYLQKKKL